MRATSLTSQRCSPKRRRVRLRWCCGLLAWSLGAASASAQDFAGPSVPLGDRSALAFLEQGLPSQAAKPTFAVAGIHWHGLPELVTRSVGAGMGWRIARLAAGLSQTGSKDVGWSALGIGLGVVHGSMGAGVRACARRPLDAAPPAERSAGIEIGAGAWTALSESVQLWASAPQTFTHGDPPPLERRLEIGGVAQIGDTRLWLTRMLAPGGLRSGRTEHAGGIALSFGAAGIWAELHDHPLRGTVGMEARAGILGVGATVESHPVLDETIRLRLVVGAQ
jgi:hypothetical protein